MQLIRKVLLTILLSLVPCSLFFSGCGGNGYKHITQDEAQAMIASSPDVIILDVRTPEEYEKKHIPGALLLPIDDLRAGDFSKLPDKDAMILVYCWTGRRAEDSAKILVEHGYKHVYEFGGLVDWTGEVEGTELK